MTDRIESGVEFYIDLDGDEDAQCARCGSSVFSECVEESIDGSYGGGVVHACISSPEWCDAHPMPGRESQKGAGR